MTDWKNNLSANLNSEVGQQISALGKKIAENEQADMERAEEAASAAQGRVETFEQRAEAITEQIATVARIVSTPIPVGIVDEEEYTAEADEQRIAFLSAENGIITLASPIEYYSRRNVLTVVSDGSLMIEGTFLDDTRDGTGLLINPVINRGQFFEFLGLFVPDANGDENAPVNFMQNGMVVSGEVKGFYRLQVVNYHYAGVSYKEYQAKIAELEAGLVGADIDVNLTLLFENNLE